MAGVRAPPARPADLLWVPADELPEFNAHIVGPIEVVSEFTDHDLP